MTTETLEKAIEITSQIDMIIDLQTLIRNASKEGVEIRACRLENDKILNLCKLNPEIAEKLIAVLHLEELELHAKFEAL